MTDLPSKFADRACQRGMTLIEILVAIVVLSIGLLGLAGLQLKGMQVNQGSTFRWQAAMLAQDIADSIRADGANATTYAGSYTCTAGPTGVANQGTQDTMDGWVARLKTLPGGTASIATAPIATGGNQLTIQVNWVDARAQRAVSQPPTTGGTHPPYTFTLSAH